MREQKGSLVRRIANKWALIPALLTVFSLFVNIESTTAQTSVCTGAPSYVVDLTSDPDGSWVTPVAIVRDGSCCAGADNNCIELIVTLHPDAEGIILEIATGAVPSGSLFYQVNCGPVTSIGQQICLSGAGPHNVTFCKPGNNLNTYRIRSVGKPRVDTDMYLNALCQAELNAIGIDVSTIAWETVAPGANGDHNSLLSCLSNCDVTTVTAPASPPPSYIDVRACGTISSACTTFVGCDTVTVTFNPSLEADISPASPSFCADEAGVTLTAVPSGGTAPFTYSWNTGETTENILATSAGVYWVDIYDADGSAACDPIRDSVTVVIDPVPAIDAGNDTTICEGDDVTLTASGADSYLWNTTATTASITVSPASTTTYTVTGTNSLGCDADDDVTVTVLTSITNNSINCNGPTRGCITLDPLFIIGSTPSGGSGSYTYQWQMSLDGSSWSDISGATSQSYNPPLIDTTTYFRRVVTSGCVSYSNACMYTIDPAISNNFINPPPVDEFCASGDPGLIFGSYVTGGGTGSYVFEWQSSTDGTNWSAILGATLQSYNPPVITETTYYRRIVSIDDCPRDTTNSVVVTIHPTPPAPVISASGSLSICPGASVTLTSSIANGNLWSPTGDTTQSITVNTTDTYIVTYTDAYGCVSLSDSATVTVEDVENPNAVCQNITIYLDASGNANIIASDVDGGSTDNCSIASLSIDESDFDCSDVGANTVTLTVTDGSGNIDTCQATVTVQDTVSPVASCQNLTVYLDGSGNASITASDVDNGSSDACGVASLSLDEGSFDCSEVGANTVTLTVTDVNGNSSTCDATITVQDTVSPVASCQNVTVYLDGSGNASITAGDIDNGSSDACGVASLSVTPSSFGCSDVGANSVTLTVTDVNGNTSTCNATVTVEDTIAPAAVCQDITIYLDASGNASITAGDINNGSSNACGVGSLSLDITDFDCSDVGANTVTLTVTDVNGNSSTCTATVTVVDSVSPVASCQNLTVYLDASGNASITTGDVDNGSSDACGIASLSLDETAFDCSEVGANTVTLTVTDVNGNSSTCDATITVQDTASPVASCQNLTVYLDASGNASITASDVDNGSSDACGIASLSLDQSTFDCSEVGANTVTLTVTDVNGNSSTCDATITVQDTASPVASCQNLTVYLDASGNASITAGDVDNGSSDACGIASLSLDQSTFDCSEVGANTVTLTVTDVNGNSSTCDATITVQDTASPVASCQNLTVYLDASGNASITAGDVDNGSSDACGIASLSLDQSTFDCSEVGANTVTLTVTDVNGNSSTCDATITVQDTASPVASCQNLTVYLDASGNASITAGDVDNGSSDACGIASLSLDQSTFDCSEVGANTVTLTVTDVNGNSSTCDATITVQDTASPVASCQNLTVYLDASGNASITASDVDNGSSDACGIASLSLDQSTFDCSEVGANTVTLTVTDVNGNSSTCTGTVTVQDTVAPIAICQDITVQLDASGNVSITASDIDNGSNDACGISSLSLDETDFDCSEVGANTVTLTVTDVNGNSSTCTGTVTVQDTVAPIAICQDITVQLDASGNVSITASDIDNGSNDACGIASLSLDQTDFDCSEVGANTVTLTVTDVNGNSSTCTATVTVEDNVDPVAVCQDITVQLDASGSISITANDIDNGSNDACGIASLSLDQTSFDCSEVGANTVTLTVTDVNGNSSTCTATVTVEDNVNPVAVCQDITVQLDASGSVSITANDIDNGSNDACGIASLSLDETNFDCSEVGANTVTLTVTDVNGNSSTCTATVTVEDNVNPVAVCQDITVQLDASGSVSITASDIDNGSNDACGVASLSLDETDFDCSEVGANTVTLTVTDVNGNSSTCTATVTVEDNVDPVAICQDITVQLDASGNASITSSDIDNGSNDACGVASLSLDQTAFDCSEVGANTVTLTVTDVNGNSSTCTATVTVEDNVYPVAVCQDITVQLDASGNASITASDIDNGSNDACGIASFSLDQSTFDCSEVGANTVTLTVTDVNGNSSTCTATVTVEDNVDPVAVCQDITVQLDASGNTSITASDIDNGSNDACGIASLSLDETAFDCSEVGANTVTLTVTDVNGNSSTCTATVTVEDNVDPVAVCQDITVYLDASGNVSITANDIDNGSNDACGIASLNLDETAFDCSEVGANTVTLTVTDVNGNSSTCTATVTVIDTIAPVVVCQDITIYLDASGNTSITASDINNGSNSACGIASMSLDQTDFDCSEVGANTVTLTVTDVNGNVSTCTATVTVMDTVSPVAICQDITVQLDASGNASITASDVDNGSNDACGIASLSLDETAFDCSEVGANTVTLTVTDVNGNSSTCTATVTVEDNVPPVAICQNITIQLDANGQASITASDIDNGSNDACGIASLNVDRTDFDCVSVSEPNTVTLTVTDVNGNVSTCSATVTVEDNVPPVAICQDIAVQLDASGSVSITASDIDNGSNDACGIASLSLDETDFDCSEMGPNTVTLTVTDVNGNVSTCAATVTIEDNEDPVAICQDITVQLDVSGNASITASDIDNGSYDACGIASLSLDQTDFDCSEVGANTVTLTVIDVNGNASTCTATVTVEDNVDPVAVCQDITVYLDGSGNVSITANDIDNGSSDACGIASLSLDQEDFDCSHVGPNVVVLTVTDVNGNSSTCFSTVTVEDTIAPTVVCQDISIYLDASGNASIAASDVDGGSSSACGVANLSVSPSTFDCSNVGANTVTLTVTDVNGNVSTCNAVVTVIDTVAPVAVCQDVTIQLDANGQASITANDIDNGSNDACGISSLSLDETDFDCSEVGANTVTLTVTDVNGNISTCSATVTVEDNVPPTALCQNVTVYLDENGAVSITESDIDNGSYDNCGVASLSLDNYDFRCSDVGENSVTLTVTDVNGNTSTCGATVTVVDTVSPVAICQDVTIYLDENGAVAITESDIDNGSFDNCGVASLSLDQYDFRCSAVGPNTVTLTVTDVNGNSSTCSATVTVVDTLSPVAICQDITVHLNENGTASITASDINNGSYDNCGVASLSVDQTEFSCNSVAEGNTVTLTVTDVNGNSSTCTATVTIVDTVAPVAICQDVTIYLDENGSASITASDIDNGSFDNCAVASLSVDQTDFSCNSVAEGNTVTLTVTDVNGNSSTCTATVTVIDTVSPVAICQDVTVYLDENGTVAITESDIDNGSFDNCGVASLSLDQYDFRCSAVGPNTVTLTVTDVNGNSSTCTATVTVVDTVAPVAICQNVTVYLDENGTASITESDVDNGSYDNCGVASLSLDNYDFRCSDAGVNTVTLTVMDVNGNSSSCTANVIIIDSVAPVAVCQDITIYLDENGSASITASDIDNGSFDNCGVASLSLDSTSFDCSEVGENTVVLTVMDVNENSSSCSATVTVLDTVSPTAICQDITVYLDSQGGVSITAADVDGGSYDNCGIHGLMVSPSDFDCSEVGANSVVLTVTDIYGNLSSCTATVTVMDTVAPTAVCQDITVYLDESGVASISASDVDGGSFDNCNVASLAVDSASFDCSEVGLNNVVLTVTDVNGNTSSCVANVTVLDTVPPVAVCQNITVYLDENGQVSIDASDVDGGSLDNCGIHALNVSPSDFSCAEVGPNNVTLSITDIYGNLSSCVAVVTVMDTVAPTAVCQNISVYLDENGQASISAGDIDNGSFDNCDIASLSIDNTSFDCSEVGNNTVTLTVTDVNGNSSTCSAVVDVIDTVAPTAICQDVTIYLDENGAASIVASDVDGGSIDNCGVALLSIDSANFDCSEVGANSVELTVTDVNGNQSSCIATVNVVDTVAPVAICQDITVYMTNENGPVISASDIDNGSFDNCGIASIAIDSTDFDCSEVGVNQVTLTVTDVNGNVSTCVSNVTVIDTIAPTAICQDINLYLDQNGIAILTPEDVDGGSIDLCGIASLSVDRTNFRCSDIGPNAVTLTVTDINGNVSTCVSTVTVLDTLAPVVSCQDITAYLDANGQVVVDAADIDNNSVDNCGIDTISIDQTNFDCSESGTNTITLTVTDYSGNSSTCTSTITIVDTVAPVTNCQDVTVYLDQSGLASLAVSDVDNGSTDNCGIQSMSIDQTSFSCANVGANTITLTVTDIYGNTSTCTSTVTVMDTTAPVVVCQDITLELDANGSLVIDPSQIDNGSSDECGIADMTVSPNSFDCSNVGLNTVVLTVTDYSGNVSTCTATLTIEPIDVTIDVNGPTAFCDGDSSTTLTAVAQNAASFLWSNDETTQTITVTEPGEYSVVVTDVNGCTAASTDTISITVYPTPVPTVDVNGPLAFCEGGSITLTSSEAAGYQWYPNGEVTQSIVVTEAGEYVVTVTDTNGCAGVSDTIVTTVFQVEHNITLDGPAEFCEGGSVTLTASDGSNYEWTPNGETTQSITVTESGTYAVSMTDLNGCVGSSADVVVTVYEIPSVTINTSDSTEICEGENVVLEVVSPGSGNTYQWNLNGSPIAGATNTTYAASEEGVYTVTVESQFGCSSGSDTIEVFVGAIPVVDAGEDALICLGDSIVLAVNGGGTYNVWSNGETTTSITVSPGATTTYIVTAENQYCDQEVSDTVVVYVSIPPVAAIELEANPTLAVPFSIADTTQDGSTVSWTWDFGDGNFASGESTVYAYETEGPYSIILTVENADGCPAYDTVEVNIQQVIDIPNVLTPNNDGLNDYLQIDNFGVDYYDMTIFNRWGVIVHQDKSKEVFWDGRTPAGVEVSPGTYYYILKVVNSFSEGSWEQSGYIELIR